VEGNERDIIEGCPIETEEYHEKFEVREAYFWGDV
jgi:hypothetical protein